MRETNEAGKSNMPDPHINEDALERYAMGRLPEQSLAEVEEHLLACPDCQSQLMEFDEFLTVFKKASAERRIKQAAYPALFRRFIRPVWFVPAAALAACLLVMIMKPGPGPVAPAIVQMQALRGPETAAQIPAGKPAQLFFDVAEADTPVRYRIEIVDPKGSPVLAVEGESGNGRLSVPVRKLRHGSYWVRLYQVQPERKLLEEYGLRAK
jgi:hypothetical protein